MSIPWTQEFLNRQLRWAMLKVSEHQSVWPGFFMGGSFLDLISKDNPNTAANVKALRAAGVKSLPETGEIQDVEIVRLFDSLVKDRFLKWTGKYERHGGRPVKIYHLTHLGRIHLHHEQHEMLHALLEDFIEWKKQV